LSSEQIDAAEATKSAAIKKLAAQEYEPFIVNRFGGHGYGRRADGMWICLPLGW
jgi:hypothetical protein